MVTLDTPALTAIGSVLVVLVLADLVWTTIAVGERRGPVSDAVARGVTVVGQAGNPGHGRRRVVGVATAVSVPAVWLGLLWLGFTLMFLSDDGAVLVSATQQPAGALGRLAYAAGGLAGAGAGLVAGTEAWQLVNNLAALTGLALVTLSLTYLMQVVSAVVNERSVMSQVSALGRVPEQVDTRGLAAPASATLPLQLVLIGQGISTAAQRHLAFPMLQYFHSGSTSTAASVNLARYDLILSELGHSDRQDHQATIASGRAAVEAFLGTLRLGGVPEPADRRQQLRAFVELEGWEWNDVLGR